LCVAVDLTCRDSDVKLSYKLIAGEYTEPVINDAACPSRVVSSSYPTCAMPCTLTRVEVWQVSASSCARCINTPLPKSVRSIQHKACSILAISNALSHKVCVRRQVKFLRKYQRKSVDIKVSGKPGLVRSFKAVYHPKLGKNCREVKKRRKSKMETESDSDDSVIILSDEENKNNPIAQNFEDEERVTEFNIKKEVENRERSDYVEKKPLKVTEKVNESKIKNSVLETSKFTRGCLDRNNAVSQEETDEDETEFERHCKLDNNFVNAKNIVKNKIGFVCDENCRTDPVEKRIKKILDQADIVILKNSLGNEEVKHYSKVSSTLSKSNPLMSTKVPTPVLEAKYLVPSSSDNDSPSTILQNVENVPQMPVVATSNIKDHNIAVKKDKERERVQVKPCKASFKEVKKSHSQVPKLLKPAMVFPSMKTKSFKIPRASKAKAPKWIANGSLWLWALSVDNNGQYSWSGTSRKKVPWASMVSKRPCLEEFQAWLVRGTYSEGDSCSWDDQDKVVKKNKEEVKIRREDMMWRERVLDQFLGKGSQMVRMFSSRDPLGLDDKDSGTGTLENGNITDDALSVRDAFEDLLENELDVSQQSLVTHIRTPTHAFCIDEGEGQSMCMDENSNQRNNNLSVAPPQQVSEDIFSFPSPPPSEALSTGFAFTKVVAPNYSGDESTVDFLASSSNKQAGSVSVDPRKVSLGSNPPGDSSILSMFVTADKSRLKLF